MTENNEKGSSKKNNALKVVIIILVVLAALSIGGYMLAGYLINSAGEKLVEEIVEQGAEENVDYEYSEDGGRLETEDGAVSYGSSASWPEDMPEDVPEIAEGSIASETSTGDGFYVSISDISKNIFEDYQSEVERSGWEITSTTSSNNLGDMFTAEKENMELSFIYLEESSSATLTVTLK